jgi:Mn2+/Fe2+ NRAMP family transporter
MMMNVSMIETPPTTPLGILRRLGPGLIIAGSIVGSGELIGATTTGAQAGATLLWLIVLGCVIKVFVQVEFGRYVIATGRTSMDGMNETPGPRWKMSWLFWYWLLMFLISLGQLGGIVGGVGQAMAISLPLTQAGRAYNESASQRTAEVFDLYARRDTLSDQERREKESRIEKLEAVLKGNSAGAREQYYWATIITVVTAVLLVAGRYGLIQWVSTFLVASFTLVTVVDLTLLQLEPQWAIGWADLLDGLKFQLPAHGDGVRTALQTFGIIGVGANELIQYPYWCSEKGYARFCGPRDATPAWADRARGWLRVLRWDAWCSMLVYTFATLAFYLLGAAILGRLKLVPEGPEMIRTLSTMYQPIFGRWTQILFLFGAFAVLYSTFFVANAGHARVCSDALRVFGFRQDATQERRMVAILSGVFPCICLVVYLAYSMPAELVLASGAMQAIMLPMLAFSAIYFRFRRSDARIQPTRLWDFCLIASGVIMAITSTWLVVEQVKAFLK